MSRVRVRSLRPYEGQKLVRLLRQGKDSIAVRRAEIVLASAQGESAGAIAERLYFSADYVRKVIHRFDEEGLDSLRAQYANGGRPKQVLPEHESQLLELAMTPPNLTGQPFTHWSLQKLRDVAVQRRLIPAVTLQTVQRILKKHHFSLQRTKTWKQSKDPDFEVKKNGVKALYQAAEKGRKQVICVDEFGPLELRPYAGRSWCQRKRPQRFRATYSRPHGVRHLLAAYDVRTGQLWGHFRKRKRACEFLSFLKSIRRKYTGRLWIVLDNWSAHKTAESLRWARVNNVRFQFLPTDASWLNRIECQFTHLKKFVLTHCDYPNFDTMRIAIQKYLRWHNRRRSRQLNVKRH